MANKIDTVSARDRLEARREPYWHRVSKGCYLGYRKMVSGTGRGHWVARAQEDGTGKKTYKALGDFSDRPDHLRFDAARLAASAWFEHLGRGGTASATTVADACKRYLKHLRATKSDKAADDAEARLKNNVLSDANLAATDLSRLKPTHLESWRDAMAQRPTRAGANRGQSRSASTLNRDMTCLRAVLNLAYVDGLVVSDFAWRGKLRPVKNADKRRELYLDREQRRRLIDSGASDVAAFLRGLSLLPLRPGALAGLTVGDFDTRLSVLKIGKDKSGKDRKIKLPVQTAALFAKAVENRSAIAPLLCRSDGKVWNKDAWKGPVKEAAKTASLPPDTTAYTLRHSVISDLVHDGLDLLTVAQISGTSVAMIERHYGHLRQDVAASALARLAL